jgi:hypothetical protein
MKAGKKPAGWTGKYTIQQYNFKSDDKPFICFEPGNDMWIRWIGGGYNHFPVNQARSDGRWAKTTDRPTHFASSPCSDPVIHEEGNRMYWLGLYGMNRMGMDDLVGFGRSWAYPPELQLNSKSCLSDGYDRAERCYRLENTQSGAAPVEMTLKGSSESPVNDPAFVIKNWKSDGARILVNGKEIKGTRVGINHKLGGDELMVFIPIMEKGPVNISIKK